MSSGELGNWLAATSFVTGAMANRIDDILASNYHVYNKTSIVRTPKPFPNLLVSTTGLKTTATIMKGAGYLAGGLGVGITGYQYFNGQISGTEASIDAAFGVIGFLVCRVQR